MAAMLAGCPDDGTPVTTLGDTSSSEGGEESNTNATVTQTTTATTADSSGSESSDTDVSTTRTTTDTDESTSSTDATAESSSTDDGGPVCGDDVADRGEECDGTDLAGNDCMSEGFQGGTIACASDCTLDTSACNNNCGNDVLDAGEDCDGAALGGEDCVSQGFDDGTLACAAGCTFDTSACTMFTCGNDLIEGTEVCDGSDLAGEDCISQGFIGGTLSCAGNCGSFDTSQCTDVSDCCVGQAMGVTGCSDDTCEMSVCGVDSFCCNNTWDGICANEALDLCPAVCPSTCGDGNVTGPETCDGANLEGQDCVTQGFAGGVLACDAMCNLDTSGCVAAVCGNGVVETGEQCDTPDLAGQDCVTQGFGGGGTLACDAACAFDTSACINAFCGNGVVEGTEVCDGAALDGTSCVTLGYNGPVESNCCDSGHGAGCDDAGCQGTICALDAFCCNNTWDDICVGEAVDNCGTLCPGLACAADCGGFDASACDQTLGACVEQDIGTATGAGVTSGSTVGEDEDLAQGCGGGGAVDHTIHFVASATGTYTFDLLGSSYDTVLSLHTGCGAAFACNDDSQGTFQSTLIVDMTAGQAVTIAVAGYSGGTGNWILNITPPTPPIPAVCDSGTDPGTGAAYVVCAADATSAWVSIADAAGGSYHPVLICQALGYADVGQWGGTCGNVCGYCEGATACDANGAATFDAGPWTGLGNCTPDGLGEVLCQTVQWTCI